MVNVANLHSQPLCHNESCVFAAVNQPAWRVLPPANDAARVAAAITASPQS